MLAEVAECIHMVKTELDSHIEQLKIAKKPCGPQRSYEVNTIKICTGNRRT